MKSRLTGTWISSNRSPVGTGSGYQAAVLAGIVEAVYAIEIRKTLADRAEKTLADLGHRNVRVKYADGYFGWQEHAPFDAIIITAVANHIPRRSSSS